MARRMTRSEVLGELPTRRNAAVLPAVLLTLTAALAVLVAVALDTPFHPLATLTVALALVAATGAVILGEQHRRRGQRTDRFISGVYRRLGASAPSRELVSAKRWRKGVPGLLVARPAASIDVTDPDLRAALVAQANKDFLPPVEVERERADVYEVLEVTRRHRDVLRLALTDFRPGTPNAVRKRNTELAHTLIDKRASASTKFDGDEPVEVSVRYPATAGPALSIESNQYRTELAFSSVMPGKWKGEWDLEADLVTFERRPPLPRKKDNDPTPLPAGELYGEVEIPFAIDEYGATLTWAPWINPMFLDTGSTGTGKTVLQHTLLTNIARMGWEVRVLDGKAVEFLGYRSWPNVSVVASWVHEQIAVIHGFYNEMRRRYDLIVQGLAQEEDFEPMFLLIDEYRTFQEEATDWYLGVKRTGEPAKVPAFARLGGIARLGRTARMHLIVGLQRPDAEFLTGEMRENFSMRAAMGRISPQQSDMMWNNQYTGVALPSRTRGRGHAVGADGNPVEMLALWTPDPRRARSAEDLAILDALRPAEDLFGKQRFESIEWDFELDEKHQHPAYDRYANAALVPIDDAYVDARAADLEEAKRRRLERETALEDEPVVDDPFADYEPAIQTRVSDVRPGDLVEIDPGEWAVLIAEPAADPAHSASVVLDLRRMDTGEPDVLSVSGSDRVAVRQPRGDVEEQP